MANEFFTILTATGRNKLANATATGTPLTLTQMAVGDGDPATPGGAYYNPTEAQATLKHEVWRGAINHLAVDANNPNWIVAELVIPDDVGGFYIREVGLFDNTGAMIAVGKFPESYKPTLAAGSNKQLYVRMILEVANTSAVTLLVDPSVVLATRQYCDDKVASEINKLDGKQSVRVATTAAIALSGLLTIDGVMLAAGDRVLVKDQAATKDNGIYVVAAGNWTRAADADAAIEVTPGLFVSVEQGTANADSIWQLVTDAPITLGTTGLVFEMVGGMTGVTAGTYRSVTVNQRGQVTGGTNPATLAGFGISDAFTKTEADSRFFGRVQRFTSNGSFTVPAGVTTIFVSGCAGGGGGGGGAGTSGQTAVVGGGGAGGGGAGQSQIRIPYVVAPGQVIAITIGGGGTAGLGSTSANSGGTNGGNGGNTVIGALATLTGGGGGGLGGWVASNNIGGGGAGAAGGPGYPNGSFGSDGNYLGNGGDGASSPFGGGGARGRAATSAGIPGTAGIGYGSGGGGGGAAYGTNPNNGGGGGAGAPGIVIIEW